MPKIARELTDVAVRKIDTPGWHAVGGVAGLLLQVRNPTGSGSKLSKSWVLRIKNGSRRVPLGLGSYPLVPLKEARDKARRLVMEARDGIDLLESKRARRQALIDAQAKTKTFLDAANEYLEAHSADYTNEKHRKQWASTLEAYAYPVIGKIPVADIEMIHVLQVLTQETKDKEGESAKLWYAKPQTAYRLLGRIKTVLDAATVAGYRSGTNPATWTGYLDTQLPSPKKVRPVTHHKAVPYERIAEVMAALKKNTSISSKALQFLCLTAVRSGSVRQAEWSEIDLNKKLWIIPPAHTKTRQEHRVPLQAEAIELLKSLPKMVGVKKIFPSPRGTALSDMALSQLMRGMLERGDITVEAVPHGFRSTFRDWAAEKTAYPDEIRKAVSGHTVGDAVQKAYQRTDLLEKRRELMNDWAKFVSTRSGKRVYKLGEQTHA
ncbi:MAG: tyrosine-type recombinase/integrase [Burkholderiaceae bacterium]